MLAVGVPLVLVLGALAELVAGVAAAGFRRRALAPFLGLWTDLRRTFDRADRATLLESLGAGVALFGTGLVGAAALGAGPGGLPLLYLAMGLGVAGAHLVAVEASTRPAADRARGRLLEALAVEPVAAVALGAAFLRWRAEDLDQLWGVGDVLGNALQVGPIPATVGVILALLALTGAAVLRVPAEPEPRRGRTGRPGGGGVLLRISRWAVAGATAALVPALLVGLDVTRARLDLDLLIWVGTAAVASAVLGGMWGGASLLPGWMRLAVLLPVLVLLAAAGVVLVVVLG